MSDTDYYPRALYRPAEVAETPDAPADSTLVNNREEHQAMLKEGWKDHASATPVPKEETPAKRRKKPAKKAAKKTKKGSR